MQLLTGFYTDVAKRHEAVRKRPFRIQRYISQELTELLGQKLDQANLRPHVAARTLSNKHSGAYLWLQAVPRTRALRLEKREFQLGCWMRLGLNPDNTVAGRACKCGEVYTRNSFEQLSHMLSCRHLGKRITRHNSILDDIYCWVRARGVQVEKEVLVNEDGLHRVDIWVRNDAVEHWADVTVVEPGCPTQLARAAKEEGAAVCAGEARKMAKWKDLAMEYKATVQPLAFETTGRRGPNVDKFLKAVAADSDDTSLAQPLSSLWLQLSVTMVKGNTRLWRQAQRCVGYRAPRVRGR